MPTPTQVLWLIEHRDTGEDSTVMGLASDLAHVQTLIHELNTIGPHKDTGWFAVYQMPVDSATLLVKGLHFYDMHGNRLINQGEAHAATGKPWEPMNLEAVFNQLAETDRRALFGAVFAGLDLHAPLETMGEQAWARLEAISEFMTEQQYADIPRTTTQPETE